MTQKKDPHTPKSDKHSDFLTDEAALEEHKSGSGFWWILLAVLVVGGGLWAVDRGYVDAVLGTNKQDVTKTETKKYSPAVQPTHDSAAQYVDENELATVLRNQEKSKRDREKLHDDVEQLQHEMAKAQGQLDDMAKAIQVIQQMPAPAPAAANAPSAEAVAAFETRLAELSEKLESLQTSYDAQSNQYKAHLQAIQLVEGLSAKLDNGQTYRKDLQALKALAIPLELNGEALAVLESKADDGVVTLAQLTENFSEATHLAIPVSLEAKETPSFSDSMRSSLANIVNIRKIEVDTDDSSDEAHIARAEAELRAGNVDMALTHLQQLSADPHAFYAAWQVEASQYLAAHNALAQLKSALVQNSAE